MSGCIFYLLILYLYFFGGLYTTVVRNSLEFFLLRGSDNIGLAFIHELCAAASK